MIIGKAISPFRIKRRNGGGGGTDADAQAFITASGISGTEATAINTLVGTLKSINVWTKIKAAYPMVGGTATSCKWNLKSPIDSNGSYRLVFSGGGTFSANGYQLNGTNAFANTFLAPSVALTLNSQHISFYSRTNSNGTEVEMGCNNSGSAPNTLLEIRTAGITYTSMASGIYTTFTDANSLGLYIGNRTASNVIKLHKNAAIAATGTTASTANPNSNMSLGALGGTVQQFYSSKQCAFASIGDGLSDAEALAFYNAVQTFNTTLGRQV